MDADKLKRPVGDWSLWAWWDRLIQTLLGWAVNRWYVSFEARVSVADPDCCDETCPQMECIPGSSLMQCKIKTRMVPGPTPLGACDHGWWRTDVCRKYAPPVESAHACYKKTNTYVGPNPAERAVKE